MVHYIPVYMPTRTAEGEVRRLQIDAFGPPTAPAGLGSEGLARVQTLKRHNVERGTTMGDHKGEDMKGRIKEAAGDITRDKNLKREGKIDQASAATKKAIDGAADKAKDVIDPKGK